MLEVPELFANDQIDEKERVRRNKANSRARKKGQPEPYPPQKTNQEQKEKILAFELELAGIDAEKQYYHKSECRSRKELFHWFCAFASEKEIFGELPHEDIRVAFYKWLDLRDKCRTDLFFLAKQLLGNKDLLERVHQPVCEMFVKKNFTNTYNADYDYGDIKDAFWRMRETREKSALILYPRSTFKSCINVADIVQWLLCCPDIKILLLTAEDKRAKQILVAVKRFFEERKPLSNLHLIFPEYILTGVASTSKEPLNCPARKDDLAGIDNTFWVKSQASQKTGSHADVVKRDDIVTPENATTPELREGVKESADDTENLILEHGFLDTIGTRYAGGRDPDYYGIMIAREAEAKKEFGDSYTDLKYLAGASWIVKPEFRELPLRKLQLPMVNLLFPEVAKTPERAFRELFKKLLANERMFRNQQLNEPIDDEEESLYKISFTEEALRAHMYQREAAPKNGDIFIVWDWALSDKKTSDYSVGVVARLYINDEGEYAFVILDIIYDKWKYSELAFQIISLSKKWGPKVTMIEQSNGYDMLRDEITRVGHKFGYQPHIFPRQPSREENAKRNRIKSVEILLSEHRLHFVLGPWIDETFKQFTQYTGEKKNKGRKDDIPDAISYLIYILPKGSRPGGAEVTDPEEEKRLQEQQDKYYRKARHYEAYFGDRYGGTRLSPGPPNQQAQTWKQWQRGEAGGLTPPESEPEPPKPQDPRMRIFGNKGPWRV
jgi:predicted phage terminase large subunit-like protein